MMPGICGFYNLSPDAEAARLLGRMTAELSPRAAHADRFLDPNGSYAVAHASHGILSTAPQPATLPGDHRICVFDGEIFDTEPILSGLRSQDMPTREDAFAKMVLSLF